MELQDRRADAPIRRKVSRRTSVTGTLLALVVLGALAWLAWHVTHGEPAEGGPGGGAGRPGGRGGPPSSTVGVATAERADIPVVLEALGTVMPAATSTVRPQVSGVLQKVLFSEGEMVKAGQLLAIIDPRQFELALMQASGQRQRDEAQLDNARLTLQRFRTLLEQDSIARQDVDTQAALVKQLEGTVLTDRASEGTARLNLGYSSIVAPISGRIGLRTVDIGNVVGTGDTNGIATITQVSPVDVQFAVPQDQVPDLHARINAKANLPVTVLDRTRANVLDTGRFLALDNQVDTQTGTVRAKARFANTKFALFPSQFVNVRLSMRTIAGAIVVPVTAVRHGSNGDFAYVLDAASRTVSLRPVKRGQATVDKVEVVSGLAVGEQVITEGGDRLKDGAHVMLPGDKPMMGGGKDSAGKGGGGWGGKRRNRGADAAGGAAAASASVSASASAQAEAGKEGGWGGRHRNRDQNAADAGTAPADGAASGSSQPRRRPPADAAAQ